MKTLVRFLAGQPDPWQTDTSPGRIATVTLMLLGEATALGVVVYWLKS